MERSKQLYVGKVFAILSVICAHMTLTIDKGQAGWLADKIIAVYGTIGVAFFFLCAGSSSGRRSYYKPHPLCCSN